MNCFSLKERLCFTDQTTSTTIMTTIRAMSTMTTTTLNQYYHQDKHQYDQYHLHDTNRLPPKPTPTITIVGHNFG